MYISNISVTLKKTVIYLIFVIRSMTSSNKFLILIILITAVAFATTNETSTTELIEGDPCDQIICEDNTVLATCYLTNGICTCPVGPMCPETEEIVGGCAGVAPWYTQECCDTWAKDNQIAIPACVGKWAVYDSNCQWNCAEGETTVTGCAKTCPDGKNLLCEVTSTGECICDEECPEEEVKFLWRYAKINCHGGRTDMLGGPTSCKSEDLWHKYADEACQADCDDIGKCGLNSFSVSEPCEDTVIGITVEEEYYPKQNRPDIQLFTRSYCPYCIKARQELHNLVKKEFKDLIEFQPYYIAQIENGELIAMHGEDELEENQRQICIGEIYGLGQWLDYTEIFDGYCFENPQDDQTECANIIIMKEQLDQIQIDSCIPELGYKYAIEHAKKALANDIYASPTLLVNGQEVTGARTKQEYRKIICASFTTRPDACEGIDYPSATDTMIGIPEPYAVKEDAYYGEQGMCPPGNCALTNACVIQGTRYNIKETDMYCDIAGSWETQLTEGEKCQNNYECFSNFCSSGACLDLQKQLAEQKGLLEQILDFLAKLFGLGG